MKSRIGVAAVLGLLAIVATAGIANAQQVCAPLDTCLSTDPQFPCPILIQFDSPGTRAYETSYTKSTFTSAPGSQLTIVGLVRSFGGALSSLNANDPNKEYTFVMSGLVSRGTVTTVNGSLTTRTCHYDSSTGFPIFRIYEGSPRNAPASDAAWTANPFGGAVVPANHQDGTLILSGELCGLNTLITRFGLTAPANGSFRANYRFTGGTKFGMVGGGEALLGGDWGVTAGLTTANYTAGPNGKFDASRTTTPVTHSTWGRLKQLYR